MRYWMQMLLIIGVLAVPTVSAQTSTASLMIDEVQVRSEDGVPVLTIAGQQQDGCDAPLMVNVEYQLDIVYLDVDRDMTAPSAVCSIHPVQFELEVALTESELAADGIVLAINNWVGMLNGIDGSFRIEPLVSRQVIVEDLEMLVVESDVHVIGQDSVGCLSPLFVRQRVVESETIDIDIFRVRSPRMLCAERLETFDEVIPLDDDFSGLFTIDVNGYQILYNFDTQMAGAKPTTVPAVIENVEVAVQKSMPPQLVLSVIGYHTDGCEFPTQVDVDYDLGHVSVSIYREIPPNVRCAAIIVQFEQTVSLGAFESGNTYTVDVNDSVIEVEL